MCLPKDTQGFLGFAEDLELEMPLLKAVVEVNEHMRRRSGGGSPNGTTAAPSALVAGD
jgi:UDPglucose 6-dehydrogenase